MLTVVEAFLWRPACIVGRKGALVLGGFYLRIASSLERDLLDSSQHLVEPILEGGDCGQSGPVSVGRIFTMRWSQSSYSNVAIFKPWRSRPIDAD